jgi:hypothetical protein
VNGNIEMLLATSHLSASTERASSPPDDTAIVTLLNNRSTQLLLRLLSVTNARAYQVQTGVDGGKTWQECTPPSQARRVVLSNLTPEINYMVQARAIGNSTGAAGGLARPASFALELK